MKGYKAFEKDFTSHNGFQYEVGKTYELGEGEKLKICKCGFHFCKNLIDVFGYYRYDANTCVAEVEALGNIQDHGTKFCTDKLRIVREVTQSEIEAQFRESSYDAGPYNSGIGNLSTFNSGNWNFGPANSGNWNIGGANSGNWNIGDSNSGSNNTGSCNHGNYNTGSYNYGSRNTGDYNSGKHNCGFFNAGDYNSGCFNTTTPTIRLFNRDTGIPAHEFYRRYGRLLDRIYEERLSEEDVQLIKSLPNFDPDIFYETTGININEL